MNQHETTRHKLILQEAQQLGWTNMRFLRECIGAPVNPETDEYCVDSRGASATVTRQLCSRDLPCPRQTTTRLLKALRLAEPDKTNYLDWIRNVLATLRDNSERITRADSHHVIDIFSDICRVHSELSKSRAQSELENAMNSEQGVILKTCSILAYDVIAHNRAIYACKVLSLSFNEVLDIFKIELRQVLQKIYMLQVCRYDSSFDGVHQVMTTLKEINSKNALKLDKFEDGNAQKEYEISLLKF